MLFLTVNWNMSRVLGADKSSINKLGCLWRSIWQPHNPKPQMHLMPLTQWTVNHTHNQIGITNDVTLSHDSKWLPPPKQRYSFLPNQMPWLPTTPYHVFAKQRGLRRRTRQNLSKYLLDDQLKMIHFILDPNHVESPITIKPLWTNLSVNKHQ